MKNKIIHLMYHDVYKCDIQESGFIRERDLPYKIKSDVFEEQVKAISTYCQTVNLPKESVVFTFDDGGKSFYNVIAPILEKYGYKGLFFISTKYIGTTNFLSEEEIRNLSNRGHVIGSHAHSHRHMYTLEKEDIETEWRESITILERILGKPIYYASIPNGDKSKSVLEYAHKYGIRNIYTSDPTTKIKDFYDMKIIGRYVVLSNDTTDTVLSIISNSRVRFILSSKHLFLGVIKKLLGSNYVKLKNYIFR